VAEKGNLDVPARIGVGAICVTSFVEGLMCPAEDPIASPAQNRAPVVLVAEDEVMIRMAIAEHLRECGFQVAEAASGAEAKALILAGLEVDLVFSDIQMPDVDGVALALWLSEQGVDAPIVLTSGLVESLEAAQAACANVSVFVPKPYDEKNIVWHFRALLSKRA
jgi:CheY-like chemotaxis protein